LGPRHAPLRGAPARLLPGALKTPRARRSWAGAAVVAAAVSVRAGTSPDAALSGGSFSIALTPGGSAFAVLRGALVSFRASDDAGAGSLELDETKALWTAPLPGEGASAPLVVSAPANLGFHVNDVHGYRAFASRERNRRAAVYVGSP